MYAMLAGRPPFRADNAVAIMQKVSCERARPIYEIQDNLPFWVNQLIERFHAKHPKDRVSTAVDASQLIRCCLQHVQNPSTGTLPRGFKVTKSDWLRPIAQGVAILLTIGLVAMAIVNWMPAIVPSSSSQQLQSSNNIEGAAEHLDLQQSELDRLSLSARPEMDTAQGAMLPLIEAIRESREVSDRDATDWNGSIDLELDFFLIELSRVGFEPFK